MEPICKRCLLEGVSKTQLEKTVEEYLESLPPDIKADSATVRNRLSLCSECEQLVYGICRLCGCFAKARAAKRHSRCPAPDPRW